MVADEDASDSNDAAPDIDMPDIDVPDGPLVLVVMGVSGSGKTTVGRLLAERLGWAFFEGDDLHPDANVKKMEGGEPLADADRQPWLEKICDLAARLLDEERSGVIACSALKRAYRELIDGGRDAVRFVYLKGSYAQIKERVAGRDGHYMPTELVRSQFDALEEPGPEENVFEISIDQSPKTITREVVQRLED
jgi:carbohydrate kinase (thermoresistant glucokinase family)